MPYTSSLFQSLITVQFAMMLYLLQLLKQTLLSTCYIPNLKLGFHHIISIQARKNILSSAGVHWHRITLKKNNAHIRFSRNITFCEEKQISDRFFKEIGDIIIPGFTQTLSSSIVQPNFNFSQILLFRGRSLSWNQAQKICESKGKSLLNIPTKDSLQMLFVIYRENMSQVDVSMQLIGLRRNIFQVTKCQIINVSKRAFTAPILTYIC